MASSLDNLTGLNSMKVLFDHSVRQDAIRAEHGVLQMQDELAGKPYSYLQFHTRVRPLRNDWRQGEIDCLPIIAGHIQSGRILPFTTDELEAEAFRALKYPSLDFKDILEGVTFEHLKSPIDRSKWGLSLEQYTSKKSVIEYCECFFLTPSSERMEIFIEGMRRNPRINLTEFEERCLRRQDIFKQICKGIDKTHYPDALHLWTAEENGIDVFLTIDKKFKNVIQHQKISMNCQVQFPSELLSALGQGED